MTGTDAMTGAQNALTIHEEAMPSLLMGASAYQRAQQAEMIAQSLKPLIEKNHLYVNISGKKHVLVEGWTTLGALVGIFPSTDWVSETETGYEARVEARTLDGALVGAAIAECSRDERRWADAPIYALKSMAQTRATSKALRMPLGFIMTLSGYESTPAEEMDGIQPETKKPKGRQKVIKAQAAFWAYVREASMNLKTMVALLGADMALIDSQETANAFLGQYIADLKEHQGYDDEEAWAAVLKEVQG